MVTEVTSKMKIDISKIKDNIVIIGLTLFFSQLIWFIAKGINSLFKPNYQIDDDHRHFSEKFDDDEDILGV